MDDYRRIEIRIDGVEQTIYASSDDVARAVQRQWLEDMGHGLTLFESRLPALMTAAIKAYEKEQAELRESLGVNKVNPLRAFIVRNWAWAVTIVILVTVLRPDLGKHLVGFVF